MHGQSIRDRDPMTEANDTIVLTIPADARYREVATLVLGGIGSRLDLPYERMDDLQLALLSVLEATDGADVSIEVEARDGSLEIAVGPLVAGTRDDRGLDLVLSRLVDDSAPQDRDGAEWLTLSVSHSQTRDPRA